jgi:hypothetical protein
MMRAMILPTGGWSSRDAVAHILDVVSVDGEGVTNLESYQPSNSLQPGKVVNWLIIHRPSMCSINLPDTT